jgi:hypothetical protein
LKLPEFAEDNGVFFLLDKIGERGETSIDGLFELEASSARISVIIISEMLLSEKEDSCEEENWDSRLLRSIFELH